VPVGPEHFIRSYKVSKFKVYVTRAIPQETIDTLHRFHDGWHGWAPQTCINPEVLK
jgi:hypothetical protein